MRGVLAFEEEVPPLLRSSSVSRQSSINDCYRAQCAMTAAGPFSDRRCDVIPGISSVMIWSPISPERDRTHEEALFGRADHWVSAGWGSGIAVKELCRKHGFSEASYYLWKSKFGGMSVSDAKRLKELETENARLKKLLAESVLENEVAREALRKKW